MAGWSPSWRAAAPGAHLRQVAVTAVGEIGRDMAGTYATLGGPLAASEARVAEPAREVAGLKGGKAD